VRQFEYVFKEKSAYMFCTVNDINKRKPFPQDFSGLLDVGRAIKNDKIPEFLVGINPLHVGLEQSRDIRSVLLVSVRHMA
jgi:hypothetical protein